MHHNIRDLGEIENTLTQSRGCITALGAKPISFVPRTEMGLRDRDQGIRLVGIWQGSARSS
jgi:hypothetical protein